MLAGIAPLLTPLVEKAPDANDVVAGWMGFAVFIGLILAVVVLGWSLVRQLRKTDKAAADGVFGAEAAEKVARARGGSAADER
ncbi:hypothetical protein [Nocardioides sambongensis]|uniref:hypothetical protein n=1 Tax=Nocardioides sambongensis TaxID=2589074 RepID=UPI001126C22F|nr:hypothetical protein [Nocardioides sambongensis]